MFQQPRRPQQRRPKAQAHFVPADRIVSIEHPCIIQNFQRGLKSLQGEAQLKNVTEASLDPPPSRFGKPSNPTASKVIEHQRGDSKLNSKLPEPVATVSLRPNDPFARKLRSECIVTENVLIKVTLRKRTGRKRKRGSSEPFTEVHEPGATPTTLKAPEFWQRLRDNESSPVVQPLAMIYETHRFRSLPDYQYRVGDKPIYQEIRNHAMSSDYSQIREFKISLDPGLTDPADLAPPPSFSNTTQPHKYEYEQAAGIILVADENGNIISKNTGRPRKRLIWLLPPDVPEVPHGPPPHIKDRKATGKQVQRAIRELEALLAERPLVTKRVALNALPPISDTVLKEAMEYVGYSFKAGPWRDSLIRYGVDPRKDPRFRFYQTLMFQIDKPSFKLAGTSTGTSTSAWARTLRHRKDDPTTHIFDGTSASANGKTWQVCDVTDPIIRDIFYTDPVQTVCDVFQWGWYHNGTMSKARTIMKDKMKYLFAGQDPPEDDYPPIAALPHSLGPDNIHETVFSAKLYGEHISALTTEVRGVAKAGEGARELKSSREGREDFGEAAMAEDADVNADDAGEIDLDLDDELDEDEEQGDFVESDVDDNDQVVPDHQDA